MNRKDFLKLTGMSAGAFILANCVSSCKKNETASPTNIDFTLDLAASANVSLNTAGGFIYNSGVIVAKTTGGTYIAVSSKCTHEGTTVQYESASSQFHCPNHGANFQNDGTVKNGPATQPLQKYNTTLTGTSLRVFS